MANDPNAAELVAAAATPAARFPLAGSRTTIGVVKLDVAPLVLVSTFTRAWGGADPTKILHNQGSEQSLYPPWNRTVQVVKFTPPMDELRVASVFNRQWNGIGGIGYVPSFPQLDRKNTTWPHAS